MKLILHSGRLKTLILLFFFLPLIVFGQTSVSFQFGNGQASPAQFVGAQITLQAVALNFDGTITIAGEPIYQTLDTNASTVYTNLQGGNPAPIYYSWTVPANSGTNGPVNSYSGYIVVPSTTLGLVNYQLYSVNVTPTPAGIGWSYTWQTSDLRYAMQTGTNSYTNFVTPGVLLSTSNALASQIVGSTNGQTSIVYSNPAAFLTPQQGSNLVYALAQTNVPTSLLIITNIAYVQAVIQGLANTNFSLSISNYLATNSLASLQGTNAALTAALQASNMIQWANLFATSNGLYNAKQGASMILSNIATTGANTNIYLPGQNMTITTNVNGSIQILNATNQTFLTNGLAVWSIVVPTSYLQTNALPGLTNGFVTQTVTNGLATVAYVNSQISGGSNTNQFSAGQNASLTTNVSGTIISINATNQTFLTNGLLAASTFNAAIANVVTNTQNGVQLPNGDFSNPTITGTATITGISLAGNLSQSAGTISGNFAGSGTVSNSVFASQATNWTQAGTLAYSNSITSNNIAGQINAGQVYGIPGTNLFITGAVATNSFDTNGAARAAVSALNFQQANGYLTNISTTGANTNIYIPTAGIYFITNVNGSIQSIGASNQVWLTNNILAGYANTNMLNGWYDTNGAALNAYTNSINVSTNYANTNTAAQVAAAFAYASTNPNSLFVAATNGSATALTVQTSLTLGTDTNWIVGTNWIKVLGGGSALAHGEYQQIANGIWTNITASQNGYPGYNIQYVGGVYNLLNPSGQTLYLTNSVNGFWLQGPFGVLPVPYVAYTAPYDAVLSGDVVATNLVAQWNASISSMSNNPAVSNWVVSIAQQYGNTNGGGGTTNFQLTGVVTGPTTNNLFSTAGTNAIDAEVFKYASNPTNGISATLATQIVLNVSQDLPVLGATNIEVLGVGPNGGMISFPSGDEIYEQSSANSSIAGDSGISGGLGNGQILGERFSTVWGATNDILGSSLSIDLGNTISGGVSNYVGSGATIPVDYNTIGGGFNNHIKSGAFSFIAGGRSNLVTEDGSFVAGEYGAATNSNVFLWNDGSATNSSSLSNTFNIFAVNGLWVNGVLITNGGSGGGGGTVSNAIANLNGFGTNATLYGSNVISGVSVYSTISIMTNSLAVTNTGSDAYPGTTGIADWNISPAGYLYNQGVMSNCYVLPPAFGYTFVIYLTNTYWLWGYYSGGNLINLYSNATLTGIYDAPTHGTNFQITVNYIYAGNKTNNFISVNGTGPNGSAIIFPNGDEIYEQSFSDAQADGDSGLSIGLNNGQIFGERFSTIYSSYSDIQGSRTRKLIGGTIIGGSNNVLGNIPSGNANWATIIGGFNNYSAGSNSFLIGSGIYSTNSGTLIWSDYANGPQTSAVPNTVVFYTGAGMGINTNAPGTNTLYVNGPAYFNGDLTATNLFAPLANMSGTLSASQLPSSVVTNGSVLQLATRDNIPLPFAWYNAGMMTNSNGSAPAFIPDITGNPSNTLYQYLYNGGAALFSTTIMNGQPGWGSTYSSINPAWCMFTNGTLFNAISGSTNFTIFIVYRDLQMGSGSGGENGGSALWIGTASGTESEDFRPYNSASVVGAPNSGACAYWGSVSPPTTANCYVYDKAAQNVEIATMRAGGTTSTYEDPSWWENGVLQSRWGNQAPSYNGPPGVSLTGGIWLQGTSMFNTSFWWQGWIGEVLIYTNSLSDLDVRNVHNYLLNKYHFANRQVILDGASVMAGAAAAPQTNAVNVTQKAMGPSWEVSDVAYSGRITGQFYTNEIQTFTYGNWPGGSYLVLMDYGYNDNGVMSVITNYIISISQLCRTNGINLILGTHPSSLREEVTEPGARTNLNNWIYTNWPSLAVGLVDFASDPNVGPLGSYTNGMWILQTNSAGQVDQLHLTTNYYAQYFGPMIRNAVLNASQSSNVVVSVNGQVNLSGTFAGNGGGLTNLNPASLYNLNINSPAQNATGTGTEASPYVSVDGTGGIQATINSITNINGSTRGGAVNLGACRYNITSTQGIRLGTPSLTLFSSAPGMNIDPNGQSESTNGEKLEISNIGISMGSLGTPKVGGLILRDLYMWGSGASGNYTATAGVMMDNQLDQPILEGVKIGNFITGLYFSNAIDSAHCDKCILLGDGYGVYAPPTAIMGYDVFTGCHMSDCSSGGVYLASSAINSYMYGWVTFSQCTFVRDAYASPGSCNIFGGMNWCTVQNSVINDSGHNLINNSYSPASGIILAATNWIVSGNFIQNNLIGAGIRMRGNGHIIHGNMMTGNLVDMIVEQGSPAINDNIYTSIAWNTNGSGVTNLLLWYRADVLNVTNGGTPSALLDCFTNENDAATNTVATVSYPSLSASGANGFSCMTAGTNVNLACNQNLGIGSGDFSMTAVVNLNVSPLRPFTAYALGNLQNSGQFNGFDFGVNTNGAVFVNCRTSGTSQILYESPFFTTNVWRVVTFARVSGTGTLYIDGTNAASGTMSGDITGGNLCFFQDRTLDSGVGCNSKIEEVIFRSTGAMSVWTNDVTAMKIKYALP